MRIFISYRRDDTEGYAGWLAELLRALPGGTVDDVFLDVDDIAPGKNFVHDMLDAVKNADVLLLLIGPRWWRKSLLGANDAVRLELEVALAEAVPVQILLLDGAARPAPTALPASLSRMEAFPALAIAESEFAHKAVVLTMQMARALPRRSSRAVARAGRLQVRHIDEGHFSRGDTMKIAVDGRDIGHVITGGRVHRFDVTPGHHRFQIVRGLVRSNPLDIDVLPGGVTGVRFRWSGWASRIVCELDAAED